MGHLQAWWSVIAIIAPAITRTAPLDAGGLGKAVVDSEMRETEPQGRPGSREGQGRLRRRNEMVPIRGLYEIAIRVRDLAKSEVFYREVLGLEVGLRDEGRRWVFLRAGGDAGVVVLQEDRGTWPAQHFAFTVTDADLEGAAEALRARGLTVEGPVYHAWMPARSAYFSDPDGHALELCAPMTAAGAAARGTAHGG
jgi:catechol 2,3-dioxygenase-like lactoylglutathione lyase family enzyme